MKVDKYDLISPSGTSIWLLVAHGTEIDSFTLPEGYGIKGFIETFELDNNSDLNYEQAIGCMKEKGCYYGTTINGCSIK